MKSIFKHPHLSLISLISLEKIRNMELIGKVKKVMDLQTFSSGFKKKELILQTEEQYPQTISIEFVQDKVDLVDKVNVGDEVKISINIRGREWTNPEGVVKYFNSIVGWRIEKMENVANAQNTPEPPAMNQEFADLSKDDSDDVDDLPF